MIVPFTFASLPVSRWQNGAGETREIVRVPHSEAPFLWRCSVATLQADGPFSRFEGIDRTLVLLEGEPFWLRGGGVSHYLRRGEPWSFPGERPLVSEGIAGPGLDFNIMTLRGRARAGVVSTSAACRPGGEGIAWVCAGRWRMAGEEYAGASGIWWQEEAPGELVPLTGDALLMVTEIVRTAG
ncbi:HutD family protein [Pluralibacter gergoviae]|nr:HutD family protein [Pluralibacter gergoviae]ELC3018382.1 HutD family protein [Pluralibacter gergoviae]ELC3023508.1 HutD family protein [Pluralibacter gergoviae]